MAKIEINDDDTREILKEALLKKITPEMAQSLVQEAVRDLVKVNYHGSPSELQQQFRLAASEVARQIIREEFDKPENRQRIRDLITSAWEQLLDNENRDKLLEQLSEGISRALFSKGY